MAIAQRPLLEAVRLTGYDFHPPLWPIVTWCSTHLIGYSEIGIRLPALLSGLASLYLVWVILRKLDVDRQYIFAACLLVAMAPVGLWTSQDGRVYALFGTLYLAGLWCILSRRWLGLAAVSGLLLYAQTVGLLYLAGLWLTGLVVHGDKSRFIRWTDCHHRMTVAIMAGACAYLPWLPVFIQSTGSDFLLAPITLKWVTVAFTQAVFVGTLDHTIMQPLAMGTLILSIAAAALLTIGPVLSAVTAPAFARARALAAAVALRIPDTANPVDRSSIVLMVYALSPVAAMIAVSVVLKNIVYYRPLTPVIVPVLLWLAVTLTPRRLTITSLVIPYIWTLLLLVAMAAWSPASRGGNLQPITTTIAQTAKPGDIIYHATGTSYLPFRYYLPNMTHLLINEDQPGRLLQTELLAPFGVIRAALPDKQPGQTIWFVYARDPIMTSAAVSRMDNYIHSANADLIGTVQSWQFSTIEVYKWQ